MKLFKIGLTTLCLALMLVVTSVAAPSNKITAYRITSQGALYATVNGRSVQVEESSADRYDEALIVDNGRGLLYAMRGNISGGYENESGAVIRFDANELTRDSIFVEPLRINRLREVRGRSGRNAYIVSMADGGAGISHVYVINPKVGKVWSRDAAKVAGARNGKLIVSLYPRGEDGVDAPSIGTIYLDVDKLLKGRMR